MRELFHNCNDFRVLLDRERKRTDRTGRPFCLVIIAPKPTASKTNGRGHWERGLATTLVRRMRSTDEVGWYDKKRLGVLLPETPEEGARKFAGDFCAEALTIAPALSWEVLAYSGAPPGESTGTGASAKSHQPSGRPAEVSPPTTGQICEAIIHAIAEPLPWWKRMLDVVFSSILLAVISPIFIVVGLFIKAASRGPVFYRHERIGYLGRPFTMWKFRTMTTDCDNSMHRDYLKHLITTEKSMHKLDATGRDNRLIPLAGFLRRTCIDELPQLINVFLGDMSLVGPRPCLRYEAVEYLPWHRQRFNSLPGMTGLWQVSGKNRTTFRQMMALDIRYGHRHSFHQDLVILLRTPQAILNQIGDILRNKWEQKARPRLAQQWVRQWTSQWTRLGAKFSLFLSLLLTGIFSLALFVLLFR